MQGVCSDGAAGSSQLQWIHCRAQLSPAGKIVVPQGNVFNVFEKGQNKKMRTKTVKVKKGMRNSPMNTEAREEGGKQVLQGLDQIVP